MWNDSSEEWENPVANPEPSNDMVHFDFETGNWVKVEIDSGAGNIQNYNWDGSAWVVHPDYAAWPTPPRPTRRPRPTSRSGKSRSSSSRWRRHAGVLGTAAAAPDSSLSCSAAA